MRPNIELHIDELILDGFPMSDREVIREALQHELARLLTEQGLPASLSRGGDRLHLDGGALTVRQGTSASVVGAQVARSAYGGMGK